VGTCAGGQEGPAQLIWAASQRKNSRDLAAVSGLRDHQVNGLVIAVMETSADVSTPCPPITPGGKREGRRHDRGRAGPQRGEATPMRQSPHGPEQSHLCDSLSQGDCAVPTGRF
jgi:hypothetical protein